MERRVLLALACASGTAAVVTHTGLSRSVVVSVTPTPSLEDQRVAIRVAGLAPRESVTLSVLSTDARKIAWRSSARFRADSHGAVDVDHARALGGSYTGTWGMGLIPAMRATRSDPFGTYVWNTDRPMRFTVTVRTATRTVARTSFTRRWSTQPLAERSETVSSVGFVGDFFAPRGARRQTTVLVFGGSADGRSTALLAARFAADGYPALALAYFNEPGLSQTLTNIPLEYFQHALQWLAKRPQVDPQRIAVLGGSRGSEAGLLLGVHYPDLVYGVIALVPSNVINCGIAGAGRTAGCIGAAWTINGKPLPYTQQFNNPRPTDVPAAVIPVEQIKAPILLACGGQDLTWHSCAYSHAIIDRLSSHHTAGARSLYAYPQAGHDIGIALPYEPGKLQRDIWAPEDEQAREQLWPHILSFLRALR